MEYFRIRYNSTGVLKIKLKNLTELGKTIDDVTGAKVMLKTDHTQTNANAIYKKETLDTDITKVGNSLHVDIVPTDFHETDTTKLNLGEIYLVAVGVEFNSSGYYIQDEDPNMERKAQIIPNKID